MLLVWLNFSLIFLSVWLLTPVFFKHLRPIPTLVLMIPSLISAIYMSVTDPGPTLILTVISAALAVVVVNLNNILNFLYGKRVFLED